MINTVVDLLALVQLFLIYVIGGAFMQVILGKFLPQGLAESFSSIAEWFRDGIIHTIEALWPSEDNAEVLFLSRIVGPFTGMLFLQSSISVLSVYLKDYIIIWASLALLQGFIFIYTSPTIDDWELMLDKTDPKSRGILILKLGLLIALATFAHNVQKEIIRQLPDMLSLIFIAILPFSTIKTYL